MVDPAIDPKTASPYPGCMIESFNEAPNSAPCPRLQVEVAHFVKNIVGFACETSCDEELVIVNDGCVSGATFWYRATDLRLSPVMRLQVEDD
jgi:hypothetical protein